LLVAPGHGIRVDFVPRAGSQRSGTKIFLSYFIVGPSVPMSVTWGRVGELRLLNPSYGCEVDLVKLRLAGILNEVDLVLKLSIACLLLLIALKLIHLLRCGLRGRGVLLLLYSQLFKYVCLLQACLNW